MRRSLWCATLCGIWLCAASGCAHRTPCGTCVGVPHSADVPISFAPGTITVNWESALAADLVANAATAGSLAGNYRTLTDEEARCWAAEQSTVANMLDAERQLVCTTQRDRHGTLRPQAALLVGLLTNSAADARNNAVAAADELFYRLAEATLQHEVLRRSLAEVDQAIADFRELKERGIALPTDESKLQSQRLDLLKRQSELQTASGEAEGQLCRLLGMESDPAAPLSPTIDIALANDPVDEEQAIAAGMANRADLASLRVLCQAYQQGHLAIVRHGLQRVDALIGSGTPEGGLILKLVEFANRCAEAPVRGAQLDMATGDQTRAAKAEIRHAARTVEARRREAALMKQKWTRQQEHVAALSEKRQVNGVTAFDVSAARLEAFAAESGAISAAVAVKVAEIRLEKAQGLAAQPCSCPAPVMVARDDAPRPKLSAASSTVQRAAYWTREAQNGTTKASARPRVVPPSP